jgi:hypothetical protein
MEHGAIGTFSRDLGILAPTVHDWHQLKTVDSKWFSLPPGIFGIECLIPPLKRLLPTLSG